VCGDEEDLMRLHTPYHQATLGTQAASCALRATSGACDNAIIQGTCSLQRMLQDNIKQWPAFNPPQVAHLLYVCTNAGVQSQQHPLPYQPGALAFTLT
jgi:hypothetical protein